MTEPSQMFRKMRRVAVWSVWLFTLAFPGSVSPAPADEEIRVTLDVPFLPQTERLCGGAAAAMIFRYWGERHADVQQFAPLVDTSAGGISADRLTAAIAERGWKTARVNGSIETIGEHLARRQPLILLIEVRPRRYHFVVAVAAGSDHVLVHDPAVGPARRYRVEALAKALMATDNWALLVLPGETQTREVSGSTSKASTPDSTGHEVAPRPESSCDRALAEAVAAVKRQGLEAADEHLGAVRIQCPTSAAAASELAGVRFVQRRWSDAAALAAEATRLDQSDRYGWDVLGSSRFVQNDLGGSLDAWNAIGKPRLDSVRIDGLARTRYSLVAEFLGLTPGVLLTRAALERAERRLLHLPTQSRARAGFAPDEDGWAVARATIVERSRRPQGWYEWASIATESLIRRELIARLPGWSGQGELWSASWRWWNHRPRVAFAYAAPLTGRVPGVVGVDLSTATQTYATDLGAGTVRQEQLRAGVSLGHWITNTLRYEVNAAIDRWDRSGSAVAAGATLDRRFASDRVSVAVAGRNWWAADNGPGFRSGNVSATVRSSAAPEGLVMLLQGSYTAASRNTPLSEWPGAGDRSARAPLLRAHPLIHQGVVDGEAFGRQLASLTMEGRRWLERPTIVRLGVAGFVDVARARQQLRVGIDRPLKADAGFGVRLQLPGREGTIGLDYARSLTDRAQAVTVGWAP